jgi:prolyl-tRNA synthetase
VPTIIVVGKRLVDGVVEVRDRASGESTDVLLGDVVSHVTAVVRG